MRNLSAAEIAPILNTVSVIVEVDIGTTTTRSDDSRSVSRRIVCSGLVGIQTVSQYSSNSVMCRSMRVKKSGPAGSKNFGRPLIRLALPAVGKIASIT